MPIRSVGGEFTVNTTPDGEKWFQDISNIGNGRFVVSWYSYEFIQQDDPYAWDESVAGDIFLQVYDSLGNRIGTETRRNETYKYPFVSEIVPLENGGFIAQWSTGFVADPYPLEIFVRTFDSGGRPTSGQHAIAGGDDDTLTRLPDGRYLSTWMDWGSVLAQFLDKTGKPVGDAFQVDTLNMGYERYPEAVPLPNGNILFLWNSDYPLFDAPVDPKGISILARVFDGKGVPVGREFQVNAAPTYAEWDPEFKVTPQKDGTTLITWWSSQGDWDPPKLAVRFLDRSGQPIGDSERVTDLAKPVDDDAGNVARTTLADGRELLTWNIHGEAKDNFHAQLLNPVGQKISDEFLIEAGSRYASVSALGDGRTDAAALEISVPAGSTILDIIDAAGGMLDGHVFKAYQPGGPSSGLLPATMNDIPLDFDTLQPHGTFIGSAAVVILSDRDSARDAALNMLKFFEDESCGQCTPCRVGCEKAVKLMQAEHWDQPLLEELCQAMADASICGLGQAAPNPIRLTMKHFAEEI